MHRCPIDNACSSHHYYCFYQFSLHQVFIVFQDLVKPFVNLIVIRRFLSQIYTLQFGASIVLQGLIISFVLILLEELRNLCSHQLRFSQMNNTLLLKTQSRRVEIIQIGVFKGESAGTVPVMPLEASKKAMPSASSTNLKVAGCSSARNDSISQQLIRLQSQNTEPMVISKTYVFIIIILTLVQVDAIVFRLGSNEPTCLKIPGGKTYVIDFVVSGQNDRNVRVEIFENQQFIMKKQNVNDFRTTLKFTQGTGRVCFSRLDNKQKMISFDYYQQADPVREIIDKKDVSITMKSLNEATTTLKNVGRNQKFHIERSQINRTILERSQNKIKWAGIIKIFFLITSALIQLWIMKSFFNKNSIPYQPVEQV